MTEDPLIDLLEGIRSGLDRLAEAVEQNSHDIRRLADMQGRAYAALNDICNLMASEHLNAGTAVQLLKLVLSLQGAKVDDAHVARAAQERLGSPPGRDFVAALAELERVLVETRNRSRGEQGDAARANEIERLHRTITGENDKARR